MPRFGRLFPASRRWSLWISLGALLRLLFILFPRPVDDDTWDYLELGHNLFHHGIYGMGTGADVSPSLFRLPAYPLILATCEQLFAKIWPHTWMTSVFLLQAVADIAAGLLLASFARRHISPRAGEIALALAMLCPFTAVYSAIAMTECLSVFTIALGIYAAGRALAAEQEGLRDHWALVWAGLASAFGMLLRPDGAILSMVIAAALFGYTARFRVQRQGWRSALRCGFGASAVFCLVALLPLAPWVFRNWRQFHVFQPLAPRYLNEPGERYNAGFYRWLRTWSTEYVDTANVYWSVGSDPIDPDDLPPHAFDSPPQRDQTLQLIDDYNRTNSISPELDARFAVLAAQRIRAHPLRYYVVLPLLRVADMTLRPRTVTFYLDVFWWNWSDHPSQSAWAISLGLINLFYVAAAAWAFLRGRVPWAWMLGGYLLFRFIVLGTMENPEPRYTLECFPIFIVAAAAALAHVKNRTALRQTSSPSHSA